MRDLEKDQTLQDLILSVHHATMLTFANTGAIKIVENHLGRAFVKATQVIQMRCQPSSRPRFQPRPRLQRPSDLKRLAGPMAATGGEPAADPPAGQRPQAA